MGRPDHTAVAILPLDRNHLMADLKTGQQIEPERPVEGPDIHAPGVG